LLNLCQIFRKDACEQAEHFCKFAWQKTSVEKVMFQTKTYCTLLHRMKFATYMNNAKLNNLTSIEKNDKS